MTNKQFMALLAALKPQQRDDDMSKKEFLALLAAMKPQSTGASGPTINLPEFKLPPIELPEFRVPPPVVNVHPVIEVATPKIPAPVINLPKNEIVIPPAQVNVEVNPTPITIENKIEIPANKSIRFERNRQGQIETAEISAED